MRISIVTICYNSQSTIKGAIESVLAQDHPDVEYIVIDGASSDGTMEIVRSYGDRIAAVVSEPDKGIYDALNKGLKIATGDFVGILHSDDVMAGSAVLSSVARFAQANTGREILFGAVAQVKRHNIGKIVRYYDANRFKPWWLRFGIMPPHPATFISHEAYMRFGGYLTDGYEIAADYELLVRMLVRNKLAFARMPFLVALMRIGGISTSGIKSTITVNKEILKGCRQNGLATNEFLLLMKLPYRILEFIKRPSAGAWAGLSATNSVAARNVM